MRGKTAWEVNDRLVVRPVGLRAFWKLLFPCRHHALTSFRALEGLWYFLGSNEASVRRHACQVCWHVKGARPPPSKRGKLKEFGRVRDSRFSFLFTRLPIPAWVRSFRAVDEARSILLFREASVLPPYLFFVKAPPRATGAKNQAVVPPG